MTRLKLVDGQPDFSPDRRGVRVEDAGGQASWADAHNLPDDIPEEDKALVAQALFTIAPDAPVSDGNESSGATPLLPLAETATASPAPPVGHPETSRPPEVPVAATELAEALRQADSRRAGGRPYKPPPSPEAEAAAVQLVLAKAEVERAKADALREEARARLERERELHEARLRREEDAADREAERHRDRPQADLSPSDLAQQARDARLQAQIERDRLEVEVARTTRDDYLAQREKELLPQPPSGTNTMVLGCSGWILGACIGAFMAALLGASTGTAIAIVLIMPWVGAWVLPQVEWAPYRARVRREREMEESWARTRRREEYLAARAAQSQEAR